MKTARATPLLSSTEASLSFFVRFVRRFRNISSPLAVVECNLSMRKFIHNINSKNYSFYCPCWGHGLKETTVIVPWKLFLRAQVQLETVSWPRPKPNVALCCHPLLLIGRDTGASRAFLPFGLEPSPQRLVLQQRHRFRLL